jgi:hypothetical protein
VLTSCAHHQPERSPAQVSEYKLTAYMCHFKASNDDAQRDKRPVVFALNADHALNIALAKFTHAHRRSAQVPYPMFKQHETDRMHGPYDSIHCFPDNFSAKAGEMDEAHAIFELMVK